MNIHIILSVINVFIFSFITYRKMSSSDDLNIENYEEFFHSLIEKIKKIFVKKVNKLYSDTLEEKRFKIIEEFY